MPLSRNAPVFAAWARVDMPVIRRGGASIYSSSKRDKMTKQRLKSWEWRWGSGWEDGIVINWTRDGPGT